jgi:hypothetical protein
MLSSYLTGDSDLSSWIRLIHNFNNSKLQFGMSSISDIKNY